VGPISSRWYRLAPVLPVAALAACAPAVESSVSVELRDSAGVRIVHTVTPGWPAGGSWSVSPEPRLVVGVLSGPEEYQFVSLASAARRGDGTLVVVDRGGRAVRAYDPEGVFLMTLGGPGSGPGEFTDPSALLITPGDSVVVWDQALLRATTFDPEGGLANVKTVDWGALAGGAGTGEGSRGGDLKTIPEKLTPVLYPGQIEPLPGGELLVRLIEKGGAGPPAGTFRLRSGALRASRDLARIDTLLLFPGEEQVLVDAPWGPYPVPPPRARRTAITHHGDPPKICIGDQEGPRITCLHPDGGRTEIRWDWEARPYSSADIATWREEMVRDYDLKLSRAQVMEMLDQAPLPGSRPAYAKIFLDPSGFLWVELGPKDGGAGGVLEFLVFNPEGVLLGLVETPPVDVLEIGKDHLLGVFRDEYEVEYIHVYDIQRK
jgi:hypothetical protein